MASQQADVIRKLRYPALNMYASSRFQNERVNNAKIPLMRYNKKIRIQNINNIYQQQNLNIDDVSKFQYTDGMIHSMKQMTNIYKYAPQEHKSTRQIQSQASILQINNPKQKQKIGQNLTVEPPISPNGFSQYKKKGLKILVCVCMYNQSANAIYLTLKGIYKNLKSLESKGISPGDIAVVLIQDGILKLVNGDKTKRKTYAKDQKSMIYFYKQLDRQQKKKKCDLQQRLNVILDETQNYARKGILQKVSNNKDIPPSIQKNVALVYQNIWWPQKTAQFFQKVVKKDSSQQKVHLEDRLPQPESQKKYGLRVFSCFKHTNGTKLSSHLWFFQGFCRYLNPQFCVLLDVGTTPDQTGLLNLISGFQESRNVGGVSGFMSVDPNFPSQQGSDEKGSDSNCLTQCVQDCLFSIQKAQQYEYIMSHFLDKNQQSILGFLHVLPGAWSAYRYDALIKSDKYQPNLLQRSYFKIVLNSNFVPNDYGQANMYLAEDRILSLGIYCQMDSRYVLRYVPDARADTDPMKDHQNLMKQRRRWINSSLFAFMYAFNNYRFNVMDSRHNFCRKYVTITISMLVSLLSSFNTYITPSIYFFVLYSTIYQLSFPGSEWVAKLACFIYLLTVFIAIMGGLSGNSWLKKAHYISVILGIFTVALTFLVFWNVIVIYLKVLGNPITGQQARFDVNDRVLMTVLVMLGINLFCFFFLILIHIPTHPKSILRILIDMPSYIAFTGAYSQTMVIHSFCNVDDVSWGTKGSSGGHDSNSYSTDKVGFICTWGLVNAILGWIFIYVDVISRENGIHQNGDVVLVAISIYGTAFLFFKTILAIINHFKWIFCIRFCRKRYEQQRCQYLTNTYWKTIQNHWIQFIQNKRKN